MIKRFFYRVFCGFFLGVSIFAPGFSGSVVAIVMGVYQDLVRIVSNPFKQLKQNIKFVLPLAIGAVISAVLFVVFFKFLFVKYEKATYLLFIGLIAGNLPVIFSVVKKCGFKTHYLAGGVCAFAAALILGILALQSGQSPGSDAAYSGPSGLLIMVGSGLVAGVTIFIPGMSVSMVLILMGVYEQLLFIAGELLRLDFVNIVPFCVFAVCLIVGLVITSRGIRAVFERFPGFANSMVLGFMAGSLVGVLVQSVRLNDPNFNWPVGALMLVAGLAVSMLFMVLGKRIGSGE